MGVKKKKMAFIDNSNFHDWPIGGMLEYELLIISHLCEEYDVDFWGVSVDGHIVDKVEVDGKEHPLYIYGNVHTKKKLIPNYWRGLNILFSKEFAKRKYDIIYAHTGSCFVGALLGNKYSKKSVKVYHQHGLSYKTNKSLMVRIQKPFYWLAQRMADIVFLVTDNESANQHKLEMLKKSKARFVGIGSPINLKSYNLTRIKSRIEESRNDRIGSFIYVGRLSIEKNVTKMIEAFRLFLEIYKSNAKLYLVGDGPERISVENTVIKYQLQESVIFCGAKKHNETIEQLETADAFLISSKGEGVSLAVLEAYASGLPVVCFPVSGLIMQVEDGVTGKIADDLSAESFAKAMKFVEDNRTELSYQCLEKSKLSDAPIIARKIINEIES